MNEHRCSYFCCFLPCLFKIHQIEFFVHFLCLYCFHHQSFFEHRDKSVLGFLILTDSPIFIRLKKHIFILRMLSFVGLTSPWDSFSLDGELQTVLSFQLRVDRSQGHHEPTNQPRSSPAFHVLHLFPVRVWPPSRYSLQHSQCRLSIHHVSTFEAQVSFHKTIWIEILMVGDGSSSQTPISSSSHFSLLLRLLLLVWCSSFPPLYWRSHRYYHSTPTNETKEPWPTDPMALGSNLIRTTLPLDLRRPDSNVIVRNFKIFCISLLAFEVRVTVTCFSKLICT